ncbi:tubulin binding cofactor C-domain-containing protein [Lipomyces doorenjongii]|uniref:tubulin binding cofactor C-domain-containing protein n=1 Tax=Lipomyces doorenjongii TaxID=383834 RepID=UPI0034CDD707
MSKLHQTQQTFYINFRTAKKELDTLLAADAFPSPATDLIDAIDQKLAALIEDVQNAKVYLAPYDQRAYTSQVDQLTKEFRALKEKVMPKSKFAFSTRSRKFITNGHGAEADCSQLKPIKSSPLVSDLRSIAVHQLQRLDSKFVTVQPLPASTSILLSQISNCIIFVPSSTSFSSVRVTDCTKSILVFAGEISGPIHLSQVTTSAIVVRQAHQFRVHESSDSDILLGETGGRIIEKSDDLIFAKAEFDNANDRITISQFTESIDDFDHPAGQSPNWSTIDEDTTTKFTVEHYERIILLSQATNDQQIQDGMTKTIQAALSRDIVFDGEDELRGEAELRTSTQQPIRP